MDFIPGATGNSGNMFEANTPCRREEQPTPNEKHQQEVIISPPQLFKNGNCHTARLMLTDCQQAVQPGSSDLLLSRLIKTPHITSEAPKPHATDHNSDATLTVPSKNQDHRSIGKYSYQPRDQHESGPTLESLPWTHNVPTSLHCFDSHKCSTSSESNVKALIDTLSANLDPCNQLPPPQLLVFSGDLLSLNDWNMNRTKRHFTNDTKLYYLEQYLSGAVKSSGWFFVL